MIRQDALFEEIFRDAEILDVDFSDWDEEIRLCVIGCDVGYDGSPGWRSPIFIVVFKEVTRLECKFRHHEVRAETGVQRFRWRIDSSECSSVDGRQVVVLTQGNVLPALTIEYRTQQIHPVAHDILDQLIPGWQKSGNQGLIRKGIKSLITTAR